MNFIGLILRNGNLTKQVSHAILRNTKETGAESPQAKTIFHKLEIFYWCHLVDKRYCLVHVYYNVKIFGLNWGKAPYACLCITHLWMPYKAVRKRKQLSFLLVPYAMEYQSYSKAVSIMLYIEKQCVLYDM